LLALASLDLACRNHCPGVSATPTSSPFVLTPLKLEGATDSTVAPIAIR
jgi:hypothetical protein